MIKGIKGPEYNLLMGADGEIEFLAYCEDDCKECKIKNKKKIKLVIGWEF
jgi:hypothetical protein